MSYFLDDLLSHSNAAPTFMGSLLGAKHPKKSGFPFPSTNSSVGRRDLLFISPINVGDLAFLIMCTSEQLIKASVSSLMQQFYFLQKMHFTAHFLTLQIFHSFTHISLLSFGKV